MNNQSALTCLILLVDAQIAEYALGSVYDRVIRRAFVAREAFLDVSLKAVRDLVQFTAKKHTRNYSTYKGFYGFTDFPFRDIFKGP